MTTIKFPQPTHGLSTADCLLYATYRLETLAGGKLLGTGTGFVYAFPHGDAEVSMMITNKHVMAGCDEVRVRFHLATGDKPNGQIAEVNFTGVDTDESGIINHPDPNIDLCAFPIGGGLQWIRDQGHAPFFISLRQSEIPTAEDWAKFDSIENIEMVGCPRGIFDATSNLPIVRRGITATPVARQFEERPEFMVDMACFPGSSGSPIFLRDTGPHYDRATNAFELGNMRFYLLGILYSGPMINQKGEIVLNGLPTVHVASMMHLGQAIRSSEIFVLQHELVERTNTLSNA